VIEVIWQRETGDATETVLRQSWMMTDALCFSIDSVDVPEWTNVDEVPTSFKFAV
jgi:hypothetical protein